MDDSDCETDRDRDILSCAQDDSDDGCDGALPERIGDVRTSSAGSGSLCILGTDEARDGTPVAESLQRTQAIATRSASGDGGHLDDGTATVQDDASEIDTCEEGTTVPKYTGTRSRYSRGVVAQDQDVGAASAELPTLSLSEQDGHMSSNAENDVGCSDSGAAQPPNTDTISDVSEDDTTPPKVSTAVDSIHETFPSLLLREPRGSGSTNTYESLDQTEPKQHRDDTGTQIKRTGGSPPSLDAGFDGHEPDDLEEDTGVKQREVLEDPPDDSDDASTEYSVRSISLRPYCTMF